MFTGIIETLGQVSALEKDGENLHIHIRTPLAAELKVDQSVAHNGVCLTVVSTGAEEYTVTAIRETLSRSNLGLLQVGSEVNLERAMVLGSRLDGHLVQGHVDQTGTCTDVIPQDGSRIFRFTFDPRDSGQFTVPKGSITIEGVSLTVVDSGSDYFSVAIIPYTYEHTGFRTMKPGTVVNLEFDMIGKYIARLVELRG